MVLQKAQQTALKELFDEIKNSDLSINIDDPDGVYLLGVTVAGWAVRFRSLARPFLSRESVARLDTIEANDIAGDFASTHEARMELESLVSVVEDLWDEDSAVVVIIPDSLRRVINDAKLNEHVEKAIKKIKLKDFSGAITNCYTLTEGVQKWLLQEETVDFRETEGNIKRLHKQVSKILALDPSDVNLDPLVKQILEGLIKIVSGLYKTANKAGDRHPSRYKMRLHHARLVTNATLSYCGFLVETREFQKAKRGDVACTNSVQSVPGNNGAS